MEFENYENYPPIHYDNNVKSMLLLWSDVQQEAEHHLQRHTIKTSDSIFRPGDITYTSKFY